MAIIQLDYKALLDDIQEDNAKKRFNTKIILINSVETYFKVVNKLESLSDCIINISSDKVCTGPDTIPDLKRVLSAIEQNADKNILVTSIGEYLRIATEIEKRNRTLFSIIGHQAHSTKRVWIPIFAAKDLFLDVVGILDEEHYPNVVYEVEEPTVEFESTAFSSSFNTSFKIATATGFRAWLELWDNKSVKSGMSFSTRFAKQIIPTDGVYTLKVVTDTFQYLKSRVPSDTTVLEQKLGSDSQWLFLASKAPGKSATIVNTILHALNLMEFDAMQILSGWNTADSNTKWLFWLWYKIGLNATSDYISYAVLQAASYNDIPETIESAILSCFDNPNLEKWIDQRNYALKHLSMNKITKTFWAKFDAISDTRNKLKLLSGNNVEERAKIIELISKALNDGRSLTDFKSILSEKYPEFLVYLASSKYLSEDLQKYISDYKIHKVKDEFDIAFSNLSEQISINELDTRFQLLNKFKSNPNTYYLWVDGMGIEWIDLLVRKIYEKNHNLNNPLVQIGTAVLPTITSKNMECADPATVSKKINDLDSTSHIKDKKDCNYYLIVAKQIDIIESVAQTVCDIVEEKPGVDLVITADHGMSRMAAKGFHALEGVSAPKDVEVCSLGRYCCPVDGGGLPNVPHTKKDNNVVAFRTHAHFTASGYAPGEIHGGATPEELIVPVIYYKGQAPVKKSSACSYQIGSEVTMLSNAICNLTIKTEGNVDKVTIEICSQRIAAKQVKNNEWVAAIANLKVNETYALRIYLNNIYSEKEEHIYVKAAGLKFDDDDF